MTKERRDTTNRRLAEFEQWCPEHGDGCEHWTAYPIADYCADLNALARLEGELPPHRWEIVYFSDGRKQALMRTLDDDQWTKGLEEREAQARAEAIYKYLTRETK